MNKLLLTLGLLDLAFHFPTLTAVAFVGVYFYQNTTTEEQQEIKNTAMSIYTNSKLFINYLTDKAKELNISLTELRKKVVVDLEVPEVAVESDSTEEFINHPVFKEMTKNWTDEQRNALVENEFLQEKVVRMINDYFNQPEAVWVEASLADCLLHDEEMEKIYRSKFERLNINIDWDKIFTQKDFRQLRSKLKAVGRNADGSIEDDKSNGSAELTLSIIEDYFTNYQFCS